MRIKPKFILKELAVLAAIFLLAYFGNQQVQSWLGQKAIENTGFEHISLDAALEKAAAEDKQVLVDFAAIWCAFCRKLDNKILANPEVQKQIDAGYVFTRLEYESDHRAVFQQYGITQFPTLMVLDPTGKAIRKLRVTLEPEVFIQQL